MITRNQRIQTKTKDDHRLQHEPNRGGLRPSPRSIPLNRSKNHKRNISPDLAKSGNTIAESQRPDKVFNVLIGVTGSVATIKLVNLIQKIKSMFPRPYVTKMDEKTVNASVAIQIVMTKNSKHFAPKNEIIMTLGDPSIIIHEDADEWSSWTKMGDPVLHIELRKWADLCVIAPLDANTMAKLACGICDNLLTCTVRAWDITKPLIYCPAMNVHMYNHPMTREHLCKLQSYGYLRIDCVEKKLACGDYGMGAMASVETISDKVVEYLLRPVAKKVSVPRHILNQLPTYPILSTTDDSEFQPKIYADSEIGFELDPTRLLEQSMITEDTSLMEHNGIESSGFEQILSMSRNESLARFGDLSPLFDTSKFLALCHNKERGCFTCAICKNDYKNRKSMARHLKEQHVQGNIFHCQPCGVSYKRREKLVKHNRERHPEVLFPLSND